jgi:hypothetical protein
MAERARVAEVPERRPNREVPGWLDALPAARATWPDVPEEAWQAAGEASARDGTEYVCSQNILAYEVQVLGLDDPPWSRSRR